ncbi:CRAL-TRIO lipid binding domain [Trinorchestia longiramus]|nr:CRAL-TRIO lipid binding domain [Trinorchestia longiramus]
MSDDPPEPSKGEIATLRQSALQKLNEFGNGEIDPRDVKRLTVDDDYVRRFLMHHDNDQALALEMVIDTFKWRKEMGVNDLTPEKLNKKLFDIGHLFPHNRDKDGFRILIFLVSKHTKGVYDMEDLKRLFIYWMERLEREEYGKWISVFFDMRDTGMKNMDMEFIQYMINLFKSYYPWILNYIIVLEMPWLLNAMWSIIKSWLPPKSIVKIKFVKKSSLSEYVSKDQSLVGWGGTDDFQFSFEPERPRPLPWLANAPGQEAKKVTFLESTNSVASVSAASANSGGGAAAAPPAAVPAGVTGQKALVVISPAEELVFDYTRQGATATLAVNNPNSFPVFFKVKTTSPERFRVRPSVGVLGSGSSSSVSVSVVGSEGGLGMPVPHALFVREKFLVLALRSNTDSASQQEVSDAFKVAPRGGVSEIRLRVGVSSSADTQNGISPQHSPTETLMLKKLDEILQKQEALQKSHTMMSRLVWVLLLLSFVVLYMLYTLPGCSPSLLGQRLEVDKLAEELADRVDL